MKIKLLITMLLFAACTFAQHNSSYSQYMFNGLLLNPAYAGSNDALNLTALYRKQWLGLDGSPTTVTFSGHMPLKNKKINLGALIMSDKFGVSEHNKLNAIYAYRIRLLKGEFSFGLAAGIDVFKANWDQVKTTQLRDPSFTVNSDIKILPQAGCGVYYYRPRFYMGVSIPSLFENEFNKYQTSIFNTGFVADVSENFKIKPAVLLKYVLNSPVDINLSSTFYWKNVLGLGLGYTINGICMAYMDLRVNDQLRVGYSYDYIFNELRNYSTGSHEIMLRYLFRYKIKVSSARYF
ncbi:MAG TPA: type IX secretion system membrane protein PorP/SprF [Bacteroidia bacterium]|nr:type IX secretion system membrane protein PorP/SprF [Bacteroidia bacterium]